MPTPGKQWRHITLGTHHSWLPGDPRGFRSRGHALHSTGDHRDPPPTGEHAGVHRRSQDLGGEVTRIPRVLRSSIGERLLTQFQRQDHATLALAVGAVHAHLLVELPDDYSQAKREVGRAKQSAAQAVRGELEGRLWARGCGVKPVTDRRHHRATYAYILRHAGQGAWVWSFRDGVMADPGQG